MSLRIIDKTQIPVTFRNIYPVSFFTFLQPFFPITTYLVWLKSIHWNNQYAWKTNGEEHIFYSQLGIPVSIDIIPCDMPFLIRFGVWYTNQRAVSCAVNSTGMAFCIQLQLIRQDPINIIKIQKGFSCVWPFHLFASSAKHQTRELVICLNYIIKSGCLTTVCLTSRPSTALQENRQSKHPRWSI